MPYTWSQHPSRREQELTLWPHQSLRPRGYALFLLVTFGMITLPLYPLLGTMVMWGLLPFLMMAVAGVWFALDRNRRDSRILEVLRLTAKEISLTRHNPRGPDQNWACNAYWASPHMHPTGGPVPFYVTLRGGGREVEIGSFLSEDERKSLFDELELRLASLRSGG